MITRLVKIQLIVFAIVGVIALVVVGAKYAQLDKLTGVTQYDVTLRMKEPGGIFTNAQVTYRGVPVGRVGEMSLTSDGVDVQLLLDTGGPDIPASSVAYVANRSAIGEQFVDLRPPNDGGNKLIDGSVIDKVDLPPSLDELMSTVITFTRSVPLEDLGTVVKELGTAFDGQAESMDRLVESLTKLAEQGEKDLPQLVGLLDNSNVALGTQAEQSDQILTWSRGIDKVAAQLAASDGDIRRILDNGSPAASEISKLIQNEGPTLTKFVKTLSPVINKIYPTNYATGQTIAMLSALAAGSHSPAPGDGQIHFGLVLETNNPATCTNGYESTQAIIAAAKRKNPNFDINYDDFDFNTNAKCTVPQGNPTSVRGAARANLADPSIAQPWDNKPKKDPDKLNLNPLAQQLAWLLGVKSR